MERLGNISLKDNIGNRVHTYFLVSSVTVKPQKDGQEFLQMIMRDKDFEAEAKMWAVSDKQKQDIVAGKIYEAMIDVKPYDKVKEGYSCIVHSITVTSLDPSSLSDWYPDMQVHGDTISQLLQSIEGTTYGKVASYILVNQWQKFASWSAGKGQHHTQLGALLGHTATVTGTALRIAEQYNSVYGANFVNVGLVTAGGLLHDIGKLKELETDIASGSCKYSDSAVTHTHIMSGLLEIDRTAVLLGIDPESEEIRLLEHIIASHHGQLEWGSPINPSTVEASILHYSDALDADMWRFDKVMKGLNPGESELLWVGGKARSIYRETGKV